MIVIAEKQKKESLEKVLDSFLHDIKLKERKDITYKSYLIKFYSAVVVLPYPFQFAEANKWVTAVSTSGIDPTEYTFSKFEKEAYSYLDEISAQEPDFMFEINSLKQSVVSDKNEIQKILKSKRFKIGRHMTKREERLSLSRFLKFIR